MREYQTTTVTMDADKTCTAIFTQLSSPDLAGSWLSLISSRYGSWTYLRGTLQVRNIGTVPTGRFRISFYLSNDNILDGSDILIRKSHVWPINPDSYKNVPFSYYSSTSLTGKYIIAVIDSLNQIAEADETNNNVPYGPLP